LTTEETIFAGEETSNPVVEVPATNKTELPPEVFDFVGEGKKYATQDAALASIPHAQNHISTLEQELLTLKEELTKRKTTEDLLAELKESNYMENTSNETVTNSSGLTQEQVSQIVQESLVLREQESVSSSNVKQVVDTFVNTFGDTSKANEMFTKVASESGLSVSDLNRLAASSPNAVLKLAGIDKPSSPPLAAKLTSSINTEALDRNTPDSSLSARVISGSTKDLVGAWKNAGIKVGRQY